MISVDNAKKHPEVWIEQNTGLLRRIVNKYYKDTAKFEQEDLMQEARIATLKAIDMYDEKHNAKLSTYVYTAVCRACRDYVRDNTYDLVVSRYQQEKEWKERMGEDNILNVNKPKFDSPTPPTALRLDQKISQAGNGNAATLGDTIPSGELSVLENLIKKEQVSILREEVSKLPERERDIVYSRFWGGATYKEIAEEQGCSKQRAEVITKRALGRLSSKLKKRLEDELFV